ncbi:amidohydrolase [Pseudoflavonifractor capillosus]|uniref:amidohydrolase family protein n=1 Tax=Pseudoflavonifractor capillosus TaxID=106588 RepID=UPI001959AFF1|nr:amidohydrolase [Pseudoflavonifractor capillosus]MBM6897333.1 amidohydrolase [Pseudoflavonifractor capillosus]
MSVLFTNVTAVLMDAAGTILKNGYVQVEGTSISYVGTQRPQGDFERVVDCSGKVMMPGLVNAHTHLPMTLMRGYGGGCDLQTWLHDYIFPAEGKLDARAVSAGAGLGLAEMIASGVTCVADMYMFTSTIAQEILNAGISANLSCGGVYFGDPAQFDPNTCGDCIAQRELTDQWHGAGDGQILIDASIHGEYTSSAPLWAWMAQFAHDHHQRMHVHVSETVSEHQACLSRHGLTPIQTLNQYGVWDNGGIAAHCVYTTPEDWAIMAERGVTCVHNPYSNLKLGSGIAPTPDMLTAGVNVALGTDGMSSHNSADLFADMKLAALLPSGVRCAPGVVSPWQALEMSTAGGARALGRPTGQIVAGKVADLILLDFTAPNLTPCHDVVENLVFAAHGSNVVMNMARGRIIYENGTFHTLDVERIRAEVHNYALPLLFG